MKDGSGEGEQERWFGKGGCHESSELESESWRDCCYSGVNSATPVYGDKPGSKLDWIRKGVYKSKINYLMLKQTCIFSTITTFLNFINIILPLQVE